MKRRYAQTTGSRKTSSGQWVSTDSGNAPQNSSSMKASDLAEREKFASAEGQKCPNCGAPLRYDPEIRMVICDHCGYTWKSEEAYESDHQPDAGKDDKSESAARKARLMGREIMEPMPIYSCASCGAEVVAEAQTAALTCPYCRNNIVMSGKMSGRLQPDGIIPFKFSENKIPAMVRSYYKGKILLPRKLVKHGKIGKITGLYVPFWVYDCTVKGTVDNTYRRQLSYKRSGGTIDTTYGLYSMNQEFSMDFKNLPVDGSKRMSDDLMDSLEPYDMNAVEPFDKRYLAGFVADRFDETSDDVQRRCDTRVENTAIAIASRRTLDEVTSLRQKNRNIKTTITKLQYILMPVYYFNVSGHVFVVNGQTGKVAGQIPEYKRASRIWYASVLGGTFTLLLLLYFLFFFVL